MLSRSPLWVFVLAILVAACAPATRPSQLSVADFSRVENAEVLGNSEGTSSGTTWRCPGAPNVKVKSDYIFNGSLDYTVCVDERDRSHFLVQGFSSGGQCIYPMLASASGQNIGLVENSQCIVLQNGKAEVRFGSQSVNFMVIADYTVVGQMNQCMTSATQCPVYSEGYVQ